MKKRRLLKLIMLVGDVFLMYASLFLALAVRYGDFSFLPGPQTTDFVQQFSVIFIFWAIALYAFNFYEVPPLKKIFDFFKNITTFSFLALFFAVVYLYFDKTAVITPKTILIIHVLFFVALTTLWRYLITLILKNRKFKEKIILIDFVSGMEDIVDEKILSSHGYKVVVFFSLNSKHREKQKTFSGVAKHGVISDIKKLKEVVKKEKVETVVFPMSFNGDKKMVQKIFNTLPFNLNYVSFVDFYEFLMKKTPIEAVDEGWFLENASRFEKNTEKIIKRSVDILFSAVGILLTLVIFPFIALAVKINSKGPVFYIQKRVGKDGKVFRLYKFRTMKTIENQNNEIWRRNDEKEVTRTGKILRKLHLDEIPQFFNIFKGDLSFVGPRPEWIKLVKTFEKEIPFYCLRHTIKPGATGWAQIHYPASASVEEAKEKFKYDLYYIKNRSCLMDLSIILKTFKKIIN
jgi:exopolysaccharide biosynthesis polyprenyl glycosylphosphotransferase